MEPTEPHIFEVAEKYFRLHLGAPLGAGGAGTQGARRLSWVVPEYGPRAKMVRVELEPDALSGGVRIAVADPAAPAERRTDEFTVHTLGQLEAALVLVLDHLAGS